MKTHARLAALGAVGVSAGALALYALVIFIALRSPTGGIDFEHSILTIVSVGVIIAALVAAHLVFARQLMTYAKSQGSSGS
ncbi:MAG: hypothetical protein ACT4OZ_13995 [Gemmatimonadota bacterium]